MAGEFSGHSGYCFLFNATAVVANSVVASFCFDIDSNPSPSSLEQIGSQSAVRSFVDRACSAGLSALSDHWRKSQVFVELSI